MSAVHGLQCSKTVEVSRFDQTINGGLSYKKDTCSTVGAVNRVELDNNSCQALPLPSPVELLQAEQEDERRLSKGGGEEHWSGSILQLPQS